MESKIWLVKTTLWNGTIPMQTFSCAVPTKELAEKAQNAINFANMKDDNEDVTTEIEEICFYENENDVPILQRIKD